MQSVSAQHYLRAHQRKLLQSLAHPSQAEFKLATAVAPVHCVALPVVSNLASNVLRDILALIILLLLVSSALLLVSVPVTTTPI